MDGFVHTKPEKARFEFPLVKNGFNQKQRLLDFGQDLTIMPINKEAATLITPRIDLGFEIQHENNKKLCERVENITKKNEQKKMKQKAYLKKIFENELSRIQQSMEKSLKSIRKYFEAQLERIKLSFENILKKY